MSQPSEINPKPNLWMEVFRIVVTVLSAIAASLGIQSCS